MRTMKQLVITVVLMVTNTLAFAQMPTQQTVGNVLGGVLGGVIGSQFGQGNGKIAATVVGTMVGQQVGNSVTQPQTSRELQPMLRSSNYSAQPQPSNQYYQQPAPIARKFEKYYYTVVSKTGSEMTMVGCASFDRNENANRPVDMRNCTNDNQYHE